MCTHTHTHTLTHSHTISLSFLPGYCPVPLLVTRFGICGPKNSSIDKEEMDPVILMSLLYWEVLLGFVLFKCQDLL